MAKTSNYVAKVPDEDGIIPYTEDEHGVWHDLITRQLPVLKDRAAPEFLKGLEILKLSEDRIPQPRDVSKILFEHTGWQVEPVPALINFDRFFRLLEEKKFPAASFIRSREEMDYLQEPDIFHEIFGHCAMLVHPEFAKFTEVYGRTGVTASKADRRMLARLYWFTVEFGLMRDGNNVRSYGGGINSSYGETLYAIESDTPLRKPFDAVDALRTPYRIDIFQPVYFVIESMHTLFDLADMDLIALIEQARRLGEHDPMFPPKNTEAA